MAQQMSTQQQTALDAYLTYWDERSFREIERSDIEAAAHIQKLVQLGFSPKQIAKELVKHSPQRWIESQQVMQAARYLMSEIVSDAK